MLYYDLTNSNIGVQVMPKLRFLSRIFSPPIIIPYYVNSKLWRTLYDNDFLLYVVPIPMYTRFPISSFIPSNMYHKIIYYYDKLRPLNLNTRKNLFIKYY